MMTTLLDKMIEDIKRANGGEKDELIAALKKKREELGDDASEKDVAEAIQSCLMSQLPEAAEGDNDDGNIVLSEEDKEYMAKAAAVVKEFLDENNWHYGIQKFRSDIVLYELGFSVHNINLRVRLCVEAEPNVCRVDAVLPIAADITYEYPLCKVLAKENCARRFGSFKYDEHNGEITYEYSFLTRHGIFKDDLETYFYAVVGSAVSCYEDIRKCSVGRFKSKEANEIIQKVNALVSDIKE